MYKDALITEDDVNQLDTDIKSKRMAQGVAEFMEGEPNLSYMLGVRLGMLHDALDRAGVTGQHREIIEKQMELTLGLHIYLLQRATRRVLNGLLPETATGEDGAK